MGRFYLKNCATGCFLVMGQDGSVKAEKERHQVGSTWEIRENKEGSVSLVSHQGVPLNAKSCGKGLLDATAWHMEELGGRIIGLRAASRQWLGAALLPVEAYPCLKQSKAELSWIVAGRQQSVLLKNQMGQAEAWKLVAAKRSISSTAHALWRNVKRALSC